MNLLLKHSELKTDLAFTITGSKSESNRLLLLQALYPNLIIHNVSNSDDSEVMTKALNSDEEIVDIHHAGTAMRFLTAYFSIMEGRETVLTGSHRMKERPIGILVDALRSLGAKIDYLENEGFPPLKISGQKIKNDQVSINADVSSQYISALLLIAAKLQNGLELKLEGEITSGPYLNMTLRLLEEMGIEFTVEGQIVKVLPKKSLENELHITVESDWSSASYFYSLIALSPQGTNIRLKSYKTDSLQGDSELIKLYEPFGVSTKAEDDNILLLKSHSHLDAVNFDLKNTPDLAQTIAISCLGLGMGCKLNGLHTLKIKETDRLEALKAEIEKFGAQFHITDNSLELFPTEINDACPEIQTYNDHRMAMAFAPLAVKTSFVINEAEVVSKSYPDFWKDLKKLGIDYDILK